MDNIETMKQILEALEEIDVTNNVITAIADELGVTVYHIEYIDIEDYPQYDIFNACVKLQGRGELITEASCFCELLAGQIIGDWIIA